MKVQAVGLWNRLTRLDWIGKEIRQGEEREVGGKEKTGSREERAGVWERSNEKPGRRGTQARE